MTPPAPTAGPLSVELAHRIEAFEVVLEVHPDIDLAPHLPPPDHPLYLAVLGELIRIDMERAWSRGKRKRVADYAARFPAVLTNANLLSAVAFEEYRQRVRAGDDVQPDEYRLTFGVGTSGWAGFDHESTGVPASAASFAPTDAPPGQPAPDSEAKTAAVPEMRLTQDRFAVQSPPQRAARAKALSDAEAMMHWQEATESLPQVGTELVGFHLVEELGRGAFGRVYLARQGDLAGRLVALKVAAGLRAESNTLAQLQHTNIVPIYSYHSAGPFQAVCMPYLGRTTLAQVVQSLSSLPGVPNSGKELRSTLNRERRDTSVDSTWITLGGARSVANRAPALEGAADGWARLDGMPFVDAVLALGGQLADGLAHAHRRGILHRDLKPANVLRTDDGRPMLLDFNLAEDTKLRGSAERAMMGGTLPYMSPEQMSAFRSAAGALDGRSDVYSLGVILFELLTGKHPFPVRKGPAPETVPLMLADRATAPSVRALNASVSPGAEAIVRKCLAADVAQRYQSAEELREDIDRHLANRPLKFASDSSVRERVRKWARRHPKLTSTTTVAALALVLVGATIGTAAYARERTRDLEARGRLADHHSAFRSAQTFLDDRTRSAARLDEGLEKLRGVLKGYGVPEDADAGDGWRSAPVLRYLSAADRERVTGDIGETFFLMAQVALLKAQGSTDEKERAAQIARAARWNALAERYGDTRLPRAAREQRAAIADLLGDRAGAERLRAEAEQVPLVSARDLYLAGTQLAEAGRPDAALKHLRRSTALDPESSSAWFRRGNAHLALGHDELAVMCFCSCISLRPDFAPAWLNRGIALSRRFNDDARADFDQALKLDPQLAEAFIYRGELSEARGDRPGAIEDYTRAIATGSARAYFKRATVKFLNGDLDGAKADREAGFKIVPTDELSWVAQAENRWADDPKRALADTDEALKINPWSVVALQLKAALLSERLNRPLEALEVLDRAVDLHPDAVAVRAGRGVLLARAGKRDEALRDAKEALRRSTRPENLYQVGCIYALTAKTHPDDRREALKLLWDGLKTGWALDIVDTDTDLDALRNDPAFKNLVKDAKALNAPRPEKK